MLHRRPLVKALLEDRPENLLAVSSLGSSTWDLTAAGEDARNFRFIGAMGQAGPFALGLAMAQPDKRVLLLPGDGELLMGLGALATIANQAPTNLAIVVLDNEAYVETGSQPTATAVPGTGARMPMSAVGAAAARPSGATPRPRVSTSANAASSGSAMARTTSASVTASCSSVAPRFRASTSSSRTRSGFR